MKILDNLHAFIWSNPSANNCNTYLISGKKNILIDPGHQHLFGHVDDELKKISLSLDNIDLVLITHGHPDHMEGVKKFQDTHSLIGVSQIEMDFIKRVAPHYGEALGLPDFEPHILLQDGDLKVDDLSFEIIHSPGHSPGSFCIYWREQKVIFTGDVIFNQGVGRTDLPGGNGEQLKESILRLSHLEIEYLLSGHGDIVSGRKNVVNNFKEIEQTWFAYI